MNTHNTLAEALYNSICDTVCLSEIAFPSIGENSLSSCMDSKDSDMRIALLKQAKMYLDTDYPALLLSDYRRFSKDGNRVYFEEKYFLRRRMLTVLTLAECVEGEGRFLDKILDGLYLILEETTWCIPAHNTYIRDEKQLELPDENRPVIDLFAAETAEIVGLTESLLREKLCAISPYISEYVDREIKKRILIPYLTYHFWWMGNGLEPMCNWTPWITQNVLLALFSRKKGFMSREESCKVLKQAVVSVDYFLDEYGEDGCCNEGAQYYSHAGLCLFGCIDVLNRITGDAFAPLYEDALIGNIAAYIVKMYVGDGYYINFADCSPFPGHRDVRDYLYAVHTHNEAYVSFTAKDYKSLTATERLAFDEQNLYYHLLTLMYHDEVMAHEVTEVHAEDSYFASVGLMIARDNHYTLAVKAGNNGDSHNHNDVGSITLYKDNKPLLIDLGVETYTAKTFSPDRYDIWTMQSAYHNTLNFMEYGAKPKTYTAAADTDTAAESGKYKEPDICQRDGMEYGASDTEVSLTPDRAYMRFDMAKAYDDKRIKSVVREVTFDKNREIRIEDRIVTAPDKSKDTGLMPVMTLMSYEKPKLLDSEPDGVTGSACISDAATAGIVYRVYADNMDILADDASGYEGTELNADDKLQGDAIRIRIGELAEIEAYGIAKAAISVCPITDERLGIAWKHDCYRILLYAATA